VKVWNISERILSIMNLYFIKEIRLCQESYEGVSQQQSVVPRIKIRKGSHV
jgi:hypothetical protein